MNNYDAENASTTANPVSASGDFNTSTATDTPLGNVNQKDVVNLISANQGALIGFLAGIAVGATAALLLAPSSGREIRNRLANQAGSLKTQVADKATSLMGGANRPGTTTDEIGAAVVGNS
jgi:hypothetical protein